MAEQEYQSNIPQNGAQNGARQSIAGIVDDIVYQSEESGYVVCVIEDASSGEPVTVVGTIPYLSEGDRITVQGDWVNHPTYGRQFKAVSYDKELPADQGDILRYLAGGNIKGIGPRTAQKMVELFGNDTFTVIEEHPDWLCDVPGITKKKAQSISEQFRNMAGSRAVMLFCRDFFPSATAMRIYKKWGGGAVDRIRNNPYALCRSFNGIGFRRADQIAVQLGLSPDSPERLTEGICHILTTESQRGGHTCLPEADVLRMAKELLFTGSPVSEAEADAKLYAACRSACAESRLVSVTHEGKSYLYLPYFYRAEKYVAEKLAFLSKRCAKLDVRDIPSMIEKSETQCGFTYAKMQRQAIADALTDGVMILTGGPGTGKTTIIKGLLSIFRSLDMQISLCAPTGRAAKRMSEATSHEAKTIHRLLEMEFTGDEDNSSFARGEDNRLEEDVLIVDEASMIDILLMEALLKAVKPGARLILIGDSDQLPSVGAGNVLRDLCDCGVCNVVRLTEVFRQSETSRIILNAHRIHDGEMPDLTPRADGDFFYLRRDTEESIAGTVIDLVKNRLPRTYGADIVEKIQVITPSRKGFSGTENLNVALQGALNPPDPTRPEQVWRDRIYRVGDRVMQTKNNYAMEWETEQGKEGLGVFNGDIGVITEIDRENECVVVRMDERICRYDYGMLEELDHAYAVTVHKSQGSEYPVVVIPLYDCAPMLQTRNLLYTAVTRASKMVILVGKSTVLVRMIENNRQSVRCTLFRKWLSEAE